MKNSIMKKTWGILLGFGLSLATAAFVLTGCVIEEAEKHEIVLTLSTGATAGDATVTLTIENGDKWDSDITTGVLSGLVWTFNPTANAPSRYSVVPYRRSDTELDFTFMLTSGTYTGEVSINSFSDSTFRLYTKSSSGATYFGSGATVTINDNLPVNIYVIAAASTVTLDDGTPNDNKVTLTLSGTTWKSPLPTTGWGSLWLFEPAEGTPTHVTVSLKNTTTPNTQVEVAFTGATYTGNVEIDTTATYFNVLKGLTNIGSSTMAAAGSPVKIVVTATTEEEPEDPGDGDEPTVDDLVTALNALTAGAVTKADSTHVNFASNKTVIIPTGTTVTVPSGVTLTVTQTGVSNSKITLNGGTLKVDGTLSVKGADLDVSSTASTIEGEGVIEKNAGNSYPVLALTGTQKLTIEGVTVKGATSGQSAPVITVGGTAELTLDDGAAVTGNATTGLYGSGIRINGGTVTLKGDAEVYGNTMVNTSGGNGGGVYIDAGTLTILKGTVYGSVTFGETHTEAEKATTTDTEVSASANGASEHTSGKGDAIYWKTGATVKVGSDNLADLDVDNDYVTADGSTGFYTNVSIHYDGTHFWNIAAR